MATKNNPSVDGSVSEPVAAVLREAAEMSIGKSRRNTTDNFQEIDDALQALASLANVIDYERLDEPAGWSDYVMHGLYCAQHAVIRYAGSLVEAARRENWQLMARLGYYGEQRQQQAHADAMRELQG
jgi:hypothetical protein